MTWWRRLIDRDRLEDQLDSELRDRIAVQRPEGNDLQDEQIERPLRQVGFFL